MKQTDLMIPRVSACSLHGWGAQVSVLPQGGAFAEYFVSYAPVCIPVPPEAPRGMPEGGLHQYIAAQPLGTVSDLDALWSEHS